MNNYDDTGAAVAYRQTGLSIAANALREALQSGSLPQAMDVFKSLPAQELSRTLAEVGFTVDPALVSQGRNAVFTSAKRDLGEALGLHTDGFGLRLVREQAQERAEVAAHPRAGLSAEQSDSWVGRGFAAKGGPAETPLAFDAKEFGGDIGAARVIQRVMRSSAIEVGFLGDAMPRERQAILMVAGQGLTKGIQGFGFDGIAGKYSVPMSLAEVHVLHHDAAKAVAEESVRSSLQGWAKGDQQATLHEYVLDSVQRLLQGSATVEAAEAVLATMKAGELSRHAGEIGSHQSAALFMRQGLDVDALTVLEQVKQLGLDVVAPNRERGQYFGSVVALDHRAVMLKVSRSDLIELAFSELPADLEKPRIGDSIRLGYKKGEQSINIMSRHGVGGSVGR